MSEEKPLNPNSLPRQIKRAQRDARLKTSKLTQRELAQQRRRKRDRDAESRARADLPDGTSRALRMKLQAAQRRNETNPSIVEARRRAQIAKRVQMAKEEHGLADPATPPKFFGMDGIELERAVQESIPRPIGWFRKKAKPAAPVQAAAGGRRRSKAK
jgi:hypothetical protein